MARVNLFTAVLITLLLISAIFVIGAGCETAPQGGGGGQGNEGNGQTPPPSVETLFSDDFNTDQTGAVPSQWNIVLKDNLVASVKGTTQSNDIFGKVLELKGRLITVSPGATWKDYSIETEFKISNAGEHEGPEVMFRVQDSDNYYLLATNTQPTGTNYILSKVVAGTKSELKQRSSNNRIDDDAWHTLKLNIQGESFTVDVDDSNLLETTLDGTFATGGIGLMSHPFSDILFDNIVVIGTTA
jgi:hypothetical protein